MGDWQKVLWSEGILLTPQHFQQADRYTENLLQKRVSTLAPLGWGLTGLQCNDEGLANGEFSVVAASGVMPDGLVFDVPTNDEAPSSRSIAAHFPAEAERLDVFLAIPNVPAGSAAHSDSGEHDGRATRYCTRRIGVHDAGGKGEEREIQTAAANLRILFGGESLENYTTIKICELGKTSIGGFELTEGYVPPTLNLRTSPVLHGTLRKVLEVLSAKSTEFSKQRRNRGTGLASFSTSEAASFWLLHTVNGFIPRLQYYFQTNAVHPLDVYLELAQLCGYMYSFASEGHPKDTPAYSHTDLGGTFTRIDAKIRELMETIIPTRCSTVTLEQARPTMFTASIQDDRILELDSAVYLAVSADVPAEKIASEAPLKFKISSTDKVDQLITAALRGLPIKHMPAPPSEIPVQPGRQYFKLDKTGAHWDAIRETRTVSLYLPPEFAGLKIEMMAVVE